MIRETQQERSRTPAVEAPPATLQEEQKAEKPEQTYQTDLDRLLSALSDTQWKALQIAFGIILGAAGGFCLFFLGGTTTFGSMGLLMAVGVMLVIPNLMQRSLSRSIHLARLVSILSFALLLLAFFIFQRPI